MILTLSPRSSSTVEFARFRDENVLERLHAIVDLSLRIGAPALDPKSDPLIPIGTEIDAAGRVTKDGYGVFSLSWLAQQHPEWAGQIEPEILEIRAAIRETHGSSLRYLIWAGMGGSAEDKAMYNALGLLRKGIRCYVLDSTDPAKLQCILQDIRRRSRLPLPAVLRSTLVVGMALGMTSYEPVVNLEKLSALYIRHRIDSRPNFVYMTLPGSLLDQFAGPRGYRKVEMQPDGRYTTAGRHSAPLTRGSLYPLALAGVDLRAWIAGTFLKSSEIHTAWKLAAFLHHHGLAGRDKVTLFLPRRWSGAALWTKQDFEESLGKSEELGIKIVIGEKPIPGRYRADRLFLFVRLKSERESGPDPSVISAGHPSATLTFARNTLPSTYMQFIHYVVFGMGYLRQMNFVTQPSVELYKAIAQEIYDESKTRGSPQQTSAWQDMNRSEKQAGWRKRVTLYYDGIDIDPREMPASAPEVYFAIAKKLLDTGRAEYGELTFFGDTRYCPQGRQLRAKMERAAERFFRSRLKIPVDVYEGPAMNHSFHEMIIGHGRCFSTVITTAAQAAIPAVDYRADYHVTQFLATKLALQRRGRAVVALVVKDLSESTLAALDDFFLQAAQPAG